MNHPTDILARRVETLDAELRETLITLAPYAGYPRVVGLVGECEGVIAKWNKEQQAPA